MNKTKSNVFPNLYTEMWPLSQSNSPRSPMPCLPKDNIRRLYPNRSKGYVTAQLSRALKWPKDIASSAEKKQLKMTKRGRTEICPTCQGTSQFYYRHSINWIYKCLNKIDLAGKTVPVQYQLSIYFSYL